MIRSKKLMTLGATVLLVALCGGCQSSDDDDCECDGVEVPSLGQADPGVALACVTRRDGELSTRFGSSEMVEIGCVITNDRSAPTTVDLDIWGYDGSDDPATSSLHVSKSALIVGLNDERRVIVQRRSPRDPGTSGVVTIRLRHAELDLEDVLVVLPIEFGAT